VLGIAIGKLLLILGYVFERKDQGSMYNWVSHLDQGTGILDVDTDDGGIVVGISYEFVLKTKFENYYREKLINITFYH
jgi:hypothetical protein